MKISLPKIMVVLTIIATSAIATNTHSSETARPANAAPSPAASLATSALANELYSNTELASYGLPENVFSMAFKGFSRMREKGMLKEDSILTIIDFSRSSKDKRLFVIDLKKQKLTFHTVVSHGRNSGFEFAKRFSNKLSSNMSSLGFYVTGSTYVGSNGYSMKLEGLDKGFNDKALDRAIVMHGAPYANESVIPLKGYLGRSLGCPAVPPRIHKKMIDKIRNGNALFIYYPEQTYLSRSEWLNG